MAVHRLSRQLVYGCRGMICSNSPLAASVGIKVLQEGGNAFDAALAVVAVETVAIVPACGLGGDSFVLLYEAQTGKITGVNSSGVAASRTSSVASATSRVSGIWTPAIELLTGISLSGGCLGMPQCRRHADPVAMSFQP